MRPSSAEPAKASVCVQEEGERGREGDLLRHHSESDGLVDRLWLAVCPIVHLRDGRRKCAPRDEIGPDEDFREPCASCSLKTLTGEGGGVRLLHLGDMNSSFPMFFRTVTYEKGI